MARKRIKSKLHNNNGLQVKNVLNQLNERAFRTTPILPDANEELIECSPKIFRNPVNKPSERRSNQELNRIKHSTRKERRDLNKISLSIAQIDKILLANNTIRRNENLSERRDRIAYNEYYLRSSEKCNENVSCSSSSESISNTSEDSGIDDINSELDNEIVNTPQEIQAKRNRESKRRWNRLQNGNYKDLIERDARAMTVDKSELLSQNYSNIGQGFKNKNKSPQKKAFLGQPRQARTPKRSILSLKQAVQLKKGMSKKNVKAVKEMRKRNWKLVEEGENKKSRKGIMTSLVDERDRLDRSKQPAKEWASVGTNLGIIDDDENIPMEQLKGQEQTDKMKRLNEHLIAITHARINKAPKRKSIKKSKKVKRL